jgi:hypothetical protein
LTEIIIRGCIINIDKKNVTGSTTEYIYQRKVSTTVVHKLLTKLRLDAWGVHLTPTKYTVNEIATILRMYFTELAEPMFSRLIDVNLRAIFSKYSFFSIYFICRLIVDLHQYIRE